MERAVVLGGGGVAGIAWMAGLVAGLAERGVRLDAADRVVGTSAGSVVGAWIATGVDPADALDRQVDPARQPRELAASADLVALADAWARMTGTAEEVRRQIGALALSTPTVPEEARRAVVADRLPVHAWPDRLVVTVVDALTGQRRALDRSCGWPLVDVVAASCAVPGVWPPVTLGDRRHVDGGVHTALNADLATGADRVLVLAPLGTEGDGPLGAGLPSLVGATPPEPLPAGATRYGAGVLVLAPDDASRSAFGTDPLDPATRAPAARAGQAQSAAVADDVRALWEEQ